MKELINIDGSINAHNLFTFSEGKNKGKKLKIIGTQAKGFKAIESIDSIKNLETNKIVDVERKILVALNPYILQEKASNN